MKYVSKKEIDHIVANLIKQNDSFETRKELEQYFGESYTKAQIERIWHRYRYIKSGNEEKYDRQDRGKNQGFAKSDDGTGD